MKEHFAELARAAALDYAARGWPVFPCSPEHKRPLLARDKDAQGKPIPKTGGLAKASTDPEQIRAWWRKWPRALIGVATGHGHDDARGDNARLFVLDFDPRSDEQTGEVWTLGRLRGELEAQMGCAVPESLTSITQSGGVHVWLRWPDDGGPAVTNRGNLPRHVDVRGLGGYVIAPPSVMQTGRDYHWLRRDGQVLGPDAVAIAEAPAALVAILRAGKGEGTRPESADAGWFQTENGAEGTRPRPTSDDPVGAARRKWALAALDACVREAEGLQQGQRNQGISNIAVKLGAIIGAGYLSETTVRAELERVARLWPDVPKTLASIDSAIERGKGEPRDMSDIGQMAGRGDGGGRWTGEGTDQRPQKAAANQKPRTPAASGQPMLPSGRVALFSDQTEVVRARLRAMIRDWLHRQQRALAGADSDARERTAWGCGRRCAAVFPNVPAPSRWPWVSRKGEGASWGGADLTAEALAAMDASFEAGHLKGFDIGPLLVTLRCAERPMTDLGNAERFFARYGEDFRFTTAKGWLGWDGRRWAVLDQDEKTTPAVVLAAVFATVRAIQDEGRAIYATGMKDYGAHGLNEWVPKGQKFAPLDEVLRAWGRSSEAAGKLGCIAGLAKRWLTVPIEEFDCDPLVVNVLNGTLRFRRDDTGEGEAYVTLEPHDRADLNTRLAPVDYDPDADCPVYDGFFAWAQPSEGVRRYLHQWAGYSISGDVSEQKLQFWYGLGGNGKSVTQELWAHVAGDYSGSIGIETFLDQGIKKRGEQASPDLARLGGVRMLRASEPERGARLNEALIKAATGGEPMAVRALHRGFFDLRPLFKLTVQGNYRPEVPGTDEGIWRRLKLVPWDSAITDAERDETLPVKLRAEASGVFNHMVRGLLDWMDNGLIEPDEVREATAQYREDSDPLGRFLTMCIENDPAGRVQSSRLHEVFCAWCKMAGEKEWTNKGFSKAMKDKGFRNKVSNGIQWLGIRLVKDVGDFVDSDGKVIVQRDDGAGEARTGAGAADMPPAPPAWEDDDVPGWD